MNRWRLLITTLTIVATASGCKGEVFFSEPTPCEHFVAQFGLCLGARYDGALVARCASVGERTDEVGAAVKGALSCTRESCELFERCIGRYRYHPLAIDLPERLREQRRAARRSIKDDEYLSALERCGRADLLIASASDPDRKLPRYADEVAALYRFCAAKIPKWLVYVREKFLSQTIGACGMQVLDRMRDAKVPKPLVASLQLACSEYHLVRELEALKREMAENLKTGEFNVKRCLNPWLNALSDSKDEEPRKLYTRFVDLCYHQLAITLLMRTKAKLDREESQRCDRETRLIVDEIRLRKVGRPQDKQLLEFFFSLCPQKS